MLWYIMKYAYEWGTGESQKRRCPKLEEHSRSELTSHRAMMTKSNPMMPTWTQVQMLQMVLPLETPLELWDEKVASQVVKAVACRPAERPMKARAMARAMEVARALNRALRSQGGERVSLEEKEGSA